MSKLCQWAEEAYGYFCMTFYTEALRVRSIGDLGMFSVFGSLVRDAQPIKSKLIHQNSPNSKL